DHHHTCRNANMRMQRAGKIQLVNCLDEFEPCANCALGVMLLYFRISKIDEHAIAKDFCYHAAEPCSDISACAMDRAHELTFVFRVELSRNCRQSANLAR